MDPGIPFYTRYESDAESGSIPLTFDRVPSASEIADSVLVHLGVGDPYDIVNVKTNVIDFTVPAFVQSGPVSPFVPGIETDTTRMDGTVLMADLRNFSTWESSSEPDSVRDLFEWFSETIVQMHQDNYYDYWKLLGDGVMLVWENAPQRNTTDLAVDTAYGIHHRYWEFRKDRATDTPAGFGIAIASGSFTKYRAKTYYDGAVIQDYLSPDIAWAARVQGLAAPGEVFVNQVAAESFRRDYCTVSQLRLTKKMRKRLKGIPRQNSAVYRLDHSYYGDEWDQFVPG